MSTSVIGGLHGFLHEFVHTHAPHTPAEFYLLSLIGALLFAGAGAALPLFRRRASALSTNDHKTLAGNGDACSGFSITNLSSGSSFVIYILMPLVPFDEDLLAPLAQSWFTVALAGIIGAGITLRSLWRGPYPAQPHGRAEAFAYASSGVPESGVPESGITNNDVTGSGAGRRAFADLR